MEEKKRGGKRLGAGRKPIGNKKKPITIYVETNKLYPFGGEEMLKKGLIKFIDEYGKEVPSTIAIQDLNKHTNEIKAYEQPKTNYPINTTPVQIPLPMSQEQAYINELKMAKTINSIQFIVSTAKNDKSLLPISVKRIELYGIEISKQMYND